MIRPTFVFFFRGFFLGVIIILTSLNLIAQETQDSNEKIKEKEPFYFSGLRVGTELIHLANNVFGADRIGFEVNGDLGFSNRYFATLDLGAENYERTDATESYLYKSNGQYLRIGIDYNLLYKKTSEEALSFGLRYGNTSFKHELAYNLTDSLWGDVSGSVQESGLNAIWIEFVTAFKVKLLKNLYLSPNFRIKFLANTKGDSVIKIADIPGYGNAKSNTRASVNYSLLYRLPFGKNN